MQRISNLLMDVGLYGAIFLLPLMLGARGPVGKFMLACLVGIMAMGWVLASLCDRRPMFRMSGVEWLLCLGGGLVCAQLIPLPENVLLNLSPQHRTLLPMWFSSSDPGHVQIGTWSTISFAPGQTRQALGVYLCYVLLFVLALQRIHDQRDINRILACFACSATMLALLGLAQFLFSNGKYFWIYTHPFRSTDDVVRGPFQNQNHFAHMMALGIGPLLWLLFSSLSQHDAQPKGRNRGHRSTQRNLSKRSMPLVSSQTLILVSSLGVVSLSTLLTLSRGGLLVFSLAGVVTVAAFWLQGFWPKGVTWLVGCLMFGLLIALSIYGHEQLTGRFATLMGANSLSAISQGRHDLWDAMLTAVGDFWLTGTGIGSHPDVYPVYMEKYYNFEFTHGESGYLPLLMEAGVFGVVLLAIAVCIVANHLRFTIKRSREMLKSHGDLTLTSSAPLLTIVVVSLAHSCVDFVWYISSCMAWTTLAMALIVRLWAVSKDVATDRTRETQGFSQTFSSESQMALAGVVETGLKSPMIVSGGVLVTAISVFLLVVSYFSMSTLWPAAKGAVPWNAYRLAQRDLLETDSLVGIQQKVDLLERAVSSDPSHRKANLLLLQAHWKQASENSLLGGASADAKQARPERLSASARAANSLAYHPLEGRAYLLAMSENSTRVSNRVLNAMMRQALTVRRYDGLVNMLIGKELIVRGKLDDGFQRWQFAFNHDPDIRNILVAQLRPAFPASFLLDRLKPEKEGLRQLYLSYLHSGKREDAGLIADRLSDILTGEIQSDALEAGEQATRYFEMARMQQELGEDELAIARLTRAVELQPNNFQYRHSLAFACYRQQRYRQAIESFKWCLSRQSDDQAVTDSLKLAVQRLAMAQDLQLRR